MEFLSEILEKRHNDVLKAYDGKECIPKLDAIDPVDILFVDLIMPKIDGRKVMEFIRDKFPNDPFPIVAVSGIIIEQRDEIEETGADHYLALIHKSRYMDSRYQQSALSSQ